ncbi:DNA-binding transcriptional regulator, FadR family [Streptoalloteichus tenebrarius]|uniref:DNA-binding transcriptional regulator, FadR family n=1 Tax=Streptoalloteichus tenebrarius (strain ATCC 17920 / DSM 40477 / JCM 4838 / CBS 697.72 / NBRC 16177 / NCIMB 11028 / NRRL B-12390 / A12253. 1 / ISP 5477) TaxID=1933 RepID=A0ABT1HZ24_STRSD|nr:FadR/GntR family transcriptional regulator [Streptoalloteichus tenebrarius]MCP2260768.1 DNA-binding transcriptional regulator, FadR family [Streptoalloteichus tenebrarius]
MPLATTRRAGLVEQVIEQMRELVTSGEWPVGQRIPPEPELVSALGVGRNTVREAVRALAHAGLLEVRQGDGTFVRATSELSGAVRRLCGSELREVLEVRRALEVEGARLAAVRRTDEDLRRLEESLAARDAATEEGDGERVAETDTAFHLLLVECAHNPVLTELYRGFTEAVRASVVTTFDLRAQSQELISHTALLDAVRDQDPERAAVEAGGFLEEILCRLGQTEQD